MTVVANELYTPSKVREYGQQISILWHFCVVSPGENSPPTTQDTCGRTIFVAGLARPRERPRFRALSKYTQEIVLQCLWTRRDGTDPIHDPFFCETGNPTWLFITFTTCSDHQLSDRQVVPVPDEALHHIKLYLCVVAVVCCLLRLSLWSNYWYTTRSWTW
jgi:hypothetical protein